GQVLVGAASGGTQKLNLFAGNFASINQANFVSSSQGNYAIDIDSNTNDTTSVFTLTNDAGASTILTADQTGKVGIGVTPLARLHVQGNTASEALFRVTDSTATAADVVN